MNFHQTHSGENYDEFSAIESCWTCGGTWLYVYATEDLRAINGDHAVNCTGVGTGTGCHHYGGECPEADGECDLNLECNCLHCYS